MNLKHITDVQEANEARWQAWRDSALRQMIIDNIANIVAPTSKEYPRLRCYRGCGPCLKLKSAVYHRQDKVVSLCLETDFVHESVSTFEESEGCPGAPVKTVQFTIVLPEELINDPTKAAFRKWLKTHWAELKRHKLNRIISEAHENAALIGIRLTIKP